MGDDPLAAHFPDIHPIERHRFLTARDGNLEQAVEMLRSHLVWRSANLKQPPPLIGSTLCTMAPNQALLLDLPLTRTSSVKQARVCVALSGVCGRRQPLRVPSVLLHRPETRVL